MASILRYGQASARRNQAGRCEGPFGVHQISSRAIGGAVKQVATYTVATAADEELTITIQPEGEDARSVSFDEGAVGTTSTKAAGLVLAVNADPVLGKYVIASQSTNTVIITALQPGVGFTATESEANITLAQTTANADAPSLRPGTALVREYGTSGDKTKVTDADEDDAVAKVVLVETGGTITNNEIYTVTIRGDFDFDGVPEVYTFPYQDASASAQRLVEGLTAAINATGALPANSVTASEDDSDLILTADVAGLDFIVSASVTDDAGAAATGTLTVSTATANVAHEFAGICGMADAIRYDGTNAATWQRVRGNSAPLVERGDVWVLLDADVSSISPDDPVLFRVNSDASGEVKGAFRNAKSTSDAIPISPNRARWVDGQILTDIDGSSIALLRLI